MKKNTAHIKLLNHNTNQLERPVTKCHNKSPSLNKSRNSDHCIKSLKASCKKQKNDGHKPHPNLLMNKKQSQEEYKLEEIHRTGNLQKNKNIFRGPMNLKEKYSTNSKRETKSSSKNKNEYDLKQKKKNRPFAAKKIRRQQPEPEAEAEQIVKQQTINNQRKIQNQVKQLEYQLLTPQPTSRNFVLDFKQRIRNLSNKSWRKKSDKPSQLSSSEILAQPRLVRYNKFAFRSQKYIKLNEKMKQKQSKDKKLTKQQAQEQRPKYKSAFKRRVSKLNRQIEYYRQMSSKSQKVLKTIENIQKKQQKQFKQKKQAYIKQIQRLKQNLQEYKPNLGHIYTYKQIITESLVPDSIIIERNDENQSIIKSKIQRQIEIERRANKLIQYYMNYKENTEEQNQNQGAKQSEPSQLCLSVVSKQEN